MSCSKCENIIKVTRYNSFSKVSKRYGFLFGIAYIIFGWLRFFTFTFWWHNNFRLESNSRGRESDWKWNKREFKTTPLWQDIGVCIIFILTILVVLFGYYKATFNIFILGMIIWIIGDIIIYYINMLFFDELEVKYEWWHPQKKVWSYNRIFTQAIINLSESILLFGVLYWHYSDKQIYTPFIFSFETAMTPGFSDLFKPDFPQISTFTVPDERTKTISWICVSQILLTVFFLLIVISALVSTLVKRGQIYNGDNQ